MAQGGARPATQCSRQRTVAGVAGSLCPKPCGAGREQRVHADQQAAGWHRCRHQRAGGRRLQAGADAAAPPLPQRRWSRQFGLRSCSRFRPSAPSPPSSSRRTERAGKRRLQGALPELQEGLGAGWAYQTTLQRSKMGLGTRGRAQAQPAGGRKGDLWRWPAVPRSHLSPRLRSPPAVGLGRRKGKRGAGGWTRLRPGSSARLEAGACDPTDGDEQNEAGGTGNAVFAGQPCACMETAAARLLSAPQLAPAVGADRHKRRGTAVLRPLPFPSSLPPLTRPASASSAPPPPSKHPAAPAPAARPAGSPAAMQEAAPATAAAGAAPPPPKPFLRRGAGWEARMAAAREGRRYVPRGGAVKDYSQEGEAPLPLRRRAAGSKPPRSPVKPGCGACKAGGPAYSAQAAAAARQKPTVARAERSAPPSAVASPARPRAAERAPPNAAPAAATAGWAQRLLQQQGAPQPVAVTSAGAAGAPQSLARQVEEVSQGLAGCGCC